MSWEDYLKAVTDEDITDWETAVKEFIKKGKQLGMPLSSIDILKKVLDDVAEDTED